MNESDLAIVTVSTSWQAGLPCLSLSFPICKIGIVYLPPWVALKTA